MMGIQWNDETVKRFQDLAKLPLNEAIESIKEWYLEQYDRILSLQESTLGCIDLNNSGRLQALSDNFLEENLMPAEILGRSVHSDVVAMSKYLSRKDSETSSSQVLKKMEKLLEEINGLPNIPQVQNTQMAYNDAIKELRKWRSGNSATKDKRPVAQCTRKAQIDYNLPIAKNTRAAKSVRRQSLGH